MKNETLGTGAKPTKKRKKTDFFRIVDISAISFVVTSVLALSVRHLTLEWFLPAAIIGMTIGLIIWTYYTARMVFTYRQTDEYESNCFSRAAAAVILSLLVYVIIVQAFGYLVFNLIARLTHDATAIMIVDYIREEDNLFEIAMTTFYATFYWVRNRGYAG